jgi:hypothetical protein
MWFTFPLQFSILFFFFLEFPNVPWASPNTNLSHSHYSGRGYAKYSPDFYGRKSLLAKHPASLSQLWNYRCILPIGSAISESQMRGWNLVEPGVWCIVFEQLYWNQKAFSKRSDYIPFPFSHGNTQFFSQFGGGTDQIMEIAALHTV